MPLARKITQNLIWRGFYMISLFVVNILMARILGAEESGQFYLLLNDLALYILVTGVCLESALTYFASKEKISESKLVFIGSIWPLLSGIIFIIAAPRFFCEYLKGFNCMLTILPFAAYVVSVLLNTYYSALYYAAQDFRKPNIILGTVNGIFIVFLVFLLFNPNLSLRASSFAIAGYLFSILLQGLLLYLSFLFKKPSNSFTIPTGKEFKMIFRYISLVLLTNLVFFLVYRVDYWILDYYHNDHEVGNYIQVSKLGQVFMTIPVLMAAVIFPLTAKGEIPNLENRLPVFGRLLFSFYFVSLLILAAVGKVLFPFLYGESYALMYSAFLWLSPGILALALQALLTAYYAGRDKVKYNLYGALLALTVIVIADLILIPAFGANGAAMGSSLGYLVYAIFMFTVYKKDTGIAYPEFLLVRKNDFQWLKDELSGK